jgi:hypothetical protein
MTSRSKISFWSVTAFFWTIPAISGVLFWRGVWDNMLASKVSLYAVSIWLNACCLTLIRRRGETRTRACVYREFLIVWMISFSMTNLLWEWPWFLSSKLVFHDLHTLGDWVGLGARIREHMWLWPLASFGAVDLRTINGDGAFMAVEMLSIPSVLTFTAFYLLDRRKHRLRYVLPLFNGPMVVAGTLIFSFSEVFGGYSNMPGGLADTLLALLWTQYQYVLFPAVMFYFSLRLLLNDQVPDPELERVYGSRGARG